MSRVLRGAFLAHSLSEGLNRSQLSRQDKAFVTDLCYGTLRNLKFLDCSLAPRLTRPEHLPEDSLNCLRLAAYELLIKASPKHAAINEWVELSKRTFPKLAGLVNAVLRRLDIPETLSPAERYSLPDWLYHDWLELFSQDALPIAAALLEPEPLWLYVYRPEAEASLLAEGCKLRQGPVAHSLAIQATKALTQLEAFKRGFIGAQNPSSSLIASLLDIREGDEVLDLASGNGIKTAQLLALGAKVVSVEINAKKSKRAQQNLHRLGFETRHFIHDLRSLPDLPKAKKVLLDAPCSGTGTLRGHPEIKLRLKPSDISTLAQLQQQLLDTAWQLTESGGTLIYAVCAFSSAESLELIDNFLHSHKDASLQPAELTIAHKQTPLGTFILPFEGLDGFFFSRLRKS